MPPVGAGLPANGGDAGLLACATRIRGRGGRSHNRRHTAGPPRPATFRRITVKILP